ncbi:MAG: phage N-6-adenine-methyltransferase [Nitrososphaerota archaeon]|jgi:hypothetical protein|nr:phage N-6-adenine-methyltransferase [Nitrososphaerota archaeon]
MATESMYQNKNSNNYATPNWLKHSLFYNWHDPCPLELQIDNNGQIVNGLKTEWPSYTYVNPPYNNPLPWVEKAIEENQQGKIIALLLKHDSTTKWYHLLHQANAHFILCGERLHFNESKQAAPFPSVIAILYADPYQYHIKQTLTKTNLHHTTHYKL